MIISRAAGRLHLVQQVDHAELAGEIATSWGNDSFAKPSPFESVRLAAEKHDAGWVAPDRVPLFDADRGKPLGFLEIDLRKHAAFYGAGVAEVESIDPYAALLCSMHWTGLYRGRWGTQFGMLQKDLDRETTDFLARVVREQEERWIELKTRVWEPTQPRRVFEHDLWANYELLQAWDVLSLFICMKDDEGFDPVRVISPVPTGYDGKEVELSVSLREGTNVFEIDPFPFASSVELSVASKELEDRSYENLSEFQNEIEKAPDKEIRVGLSPRSDV